MSAAGCFAALKVVVAVICAGEVVAITTGRLPTVSTCCRQHRWLGPVVVGGLMADWYGPAVYRRTHPQP